MVFLNLLWKYRMFRWLLVVICLLSSTAFATSTALLAQQKLQALEKTIPGIKRNVLYLGLLAYENAKTQGYDHKDLLTIVDLSYPSDHKRLWVINVKTDELLFYTYVTHGAGSGFLYAKRFSNTQGSHESSIGLFDTKGTYSGKVGYALRLKGLDKGFNDHAYARAIVMHGADYANEEYIDRYGRLGRSWGCFAMPENIFRHVIDTVKNDSLIFSYYPSESWLHHSYYLKNHIINR